MHIVYYISGHGYGHGVRSCAICNQFSDNVRLTIRSSLPVRFFHEELRRDFTHVADEADCGCVQSDGVTVDIGRTARRYAAIAEANGRRLGEQVRWLTDSGADVIVSDIVPFAFEVARGAGIPSVAVTNFSWLDIYEPYGSVVPSFRPCIEHIARQYGMATLLLALEPADELRGFVRRLDMPVAGRRGINRSAEIRQSLGICGETRLALIYMGEFGLEGAAWKRLERFDGWHFIGIHDMHPCPANYHPVGKSDWRYEDMSASVDCVIGKLGYGVYAECRINAVPLIFLPRTDFTELQVLERSISEWGHGYCLSPDRFRNIEWGDALMRIRERQRPLPCDDGGARACAREIESLRR